MPTSAPTQPLRPGDPAYVRMLLALFCAGVATFAQLYSPQGVLPQISQDLGISPAHAALSVSASTLGLAATVVPWSFVGDRIGRVRAMILAVSAATVLGVAAAWAPAFDLLLVLRVLEGAALGGVPALALAYLSDEVDRRSSAIAAGWYIGGTTVGGMLGRIVAAPIADLTGWRTGMTTVSLMAVACAVVFVVLVPREAAFRTRPIGRLSTLSRSVTMNLRDRGLVALYATAFLLMGSFVAMYNYVGFHLLAPPYGMPGWLVGFVFLVYLAGTFSSPRAGALATRLGRRRVLLGGTALFMLGCLLMLARPLPLLLMGLIVMTAGFFAAHAVASGWSGARAVTARAQSTGLYNLAYYSGSSLLGFLGGIWFGHVGWWALLSASLFCAALAAAAVLLALPADD